MKYVLTMVLLVLLCQLSFAQKYQSDSPFALNWNNDGIILKNSFLVLIAQNNAKAYRSLNPQPQLSLSSKNIKNINNLDGLAVLPFNENLDQWSDIVQSSLISLSFFMFLNKDIKEITIISFMYMETILISHNLTSLAKNMVERNRPYSYFSDSDEYHKRTTSPGSSFYSSHTNTAFTNASFITTVFSSTYPDSPWRYVIGIGTFGLASTVGILRIASGNHFISDVLLGASLGTLIGWIIPYSHKIQNQNFPEINFYTDEDSILGISFTIRR